MSPLRLGIYEKALAASSEMGPMLHAGKDAGYDFFELAIDETEERRNRLTWSEREHKNIRAQIDATDMPIEVVTLSAHRAVPLGSACAHTRRDAQQMLSRAIELAAALGSNHVQVAGYFVYYEEHHLNARSYFIEGLARGCEYAATHNIQLGLENLDGQDVITIDDGLSIINEIAHDALGLHVDVGNLAGNGLNVLEQLRRATDTGHIIAVDFKDARLNEYRRVPFGAGLVPFKAVIEHLTRTQFVGPCAIEMWNDEPTIPEDTADTAATQARHWILHQHPGQ